MRRQDNVEHRNDVLCSLLASGNCRTFSLVILVQSYSMIINLLKTFTKSNYFMMAVFIRFSNEISTLGNRRTEKYASVSSHSQHIRSLHTNLFGSSHTTTDYIWFPNSPFPLRFVTYSPNVLKFLFECSCQSVYL